MTTCVLIYVTAASIEEAKNIAAACVNGRLVACANIFPEIQSIYKWKGKLVEDAEVGLFFENNGK